MLYASASVGLAVFIAAQVASSNMANASEKDNLHAESCTNGDGLSCSKISRLDGDNRNGVLPLKSRAGAIEIKNAYRVIETANSAAAAGVIVDGISAYDIQRSGLRLRGTLSDITIRNSSFKFRSLPQTAPNLPACIEIGDKRGGQITGVLIQKVSCSGFQMTLPSDRYWNGDGLSVERNVSGLVIDRFVSRDSTDGCADIKPTFRATQITLGGCKLLLRSWSGGSIDELTLETPLKRGGTGSAGGIWIKGSALTVPTLYIKKLVVRFKNPAPIFVVEDGPANVRIDECDISAPAGSKWIKDGHGEVSWTLGESCRM